MAGDVSVPAFRRRDVRRIIAVKRENLCSSSNRGHRRQPKGDGAFTSALRSCADYRRWDLAARTHRTRSRSPHRRRGLLLLDWLWPWSEAAREWNSNNPTRSRPLKEGEPELCGKPNSAPALQLCRSLGPAFVPLCGYERRSTGSDRIALGDPRDAERPWQKSGGGTHSRSTGKRLQTASWS